MTQKEDPLSRTIDSLSELKSFTIREDTKRAQQQYNAYKHNLTDPEPLGHKDHAIDEFNDNVRLLRGIFEESYFDDLIYHLTHPGRLFVIQLFAGVMRGFGVAIGLSIILFMLLYVFISAIPSHLFQSLLGILFSSL